MKISRLLSVLLLSLIVSFVYSSERYTYLLVSRGYNNYSPIIKIDSYGRMTSNGQRMYLGVYNRLYQNPEQKYIWLYVNKDPFLGLKQYEVTNYGQLTETGRYIDGDFGTSASLGVTPNLELFFAKGNGYYTYKLNGDGSFETTANNYYGDYRPGYMNISPRGDIIMSQNIIPKNFQIHTINYKEPSVSLMTVCTLDTTILHDPGVNGNAVFTSNGDHVAFVIGGGHTLAVYGVNTDSSIDSTTYHYLLANNNCWNLSITPDNKYIYVTNESAPKGIVRVDWNSTTKRYVDNGYYMPLDTPINLKVTPDGKLLIVVWQYQGYAIYRLKSYRILSNGDLEDTGYVYNYSDIEGDMIPISIPLQFLWPQAATDIPRELWGELD